MECPESVLQNLMDAGCGAALITAYRAIAEQPLPESLIAGRQACLLRGYRKELLGQLHEDQRRIDCLDHLLYQLKEQAARTA